MTSQAAPKAALVMQDQQLIATPGPHAEAPDTARSLCSTSSTSGQFSPQLSQGQAHAQVHSVPLSELRGEGRKVVEVALGLYAPHLPLSRELGTTYSSYARYDSPWTCASGRSSIAALFKFLRWPWSSAGLSVRSVRVGLAPDGGRYSIIAIPMHLRLFAKGRAWLRFFMLPESIKMRLIAVLVVDNVTNRVVSHQTTWQRGLQLPWIIRQLIGVGPLLLSYFTDGYT